MSFALWRDRLLLLILALLPLQTRYLKESAALFGMPWEQGNTSLFALEILLLATLACHLLAVVTRCEPKKAGAPLWLDLAALLPVYAFVSVFWAYDTMAALFTAIHLFEGYALAYLLWASGLRLAPALAAFVVGTTLTAALGLWQYLTQSSFASTWLGIAAHPSSEAGVAVVETGEGRFLRAYGTLPHPNVLGGYLAAGMIAAVALATRLRQDAAGRIRHQHPALLAAACILGAGLIASFSRSAWIAAAITLAAGLALGRSVSTKEVRRRISPVLLAAFAGIALAASFAVPLLSTRLSAHGRLETRSIDERAVAFADGVEMTMRYFATGVGIGNYLPTNFLSLGIPDDLYTVQPPHFVPLLVGAELGFFGLAILIGFVFVWWISLLWLLRRTSSPLVAVTATLPLVIIVVSCFDHYPFDLFAGTMLTGALFGLFLKAGESE